MGITARVDRTSVEVGQVLTLTIVVDGAVDRVQFSPIEFPKAFEVVAQNRASNMSIQGGVLSRSMSLIIVLGAVEVGTFTLGPFTVTQGNDTAKTDPIEVIVKKPIVPPGSEETPRYNL